jgi:DDE superfamily endonuclease
MVVGNLPTDWNPWITRRTHPRHGRLAGRLAPRLRGVRFARGRPTVTPWLRAAGLRQGFPGYYYFLGRLGRRTEALAGSLLRLALERLGGGARLRFALDDTPTPRYGRKVQGAGLHHNPPRDRPTSSSSTAISG